MENTVSLPALPLARRVRQLQVDNPDVGTVLVFDSAARVLAAGDRDELVTAATAMLTPVRDLLERAAAELGCGTLTSVLVEGSEGTFALADIDGDRAVVVIGERGAAPGSLLADARHTAQQLLNEGT